MEAKCWAVTSWLKVLPAALRNLERRWSLTLGAPFEGDEASCAWVAPVVRADGTSVMPKLGMPHMEGEHEIHGLHFWDGDPTVRLLEADDELGAMVLERCERPGVSPQSGPGLSERHVLGIAVGLSDYPF